MRCRQPQLGVMDINWDENLSALSALTGLTRLALGGIIRYGIPTELPHFCDLELDLQNVLPDPGALFFFLFIIFGTCRA